MSACCKVLPFCSKCACEKKQGLADAITQPTLDPIGTVREVPQLRDDCGCMGGGVGVEPNKRNQCEWVCDDPDIDELVTHIMDYG